MVKSSNHLPKSSTLVSTKSIKHSNEFCLSFLFFHCKKYVSSNQIFSYSLRFKVSGDELCQTWKLTLEKSMFQVKVLQGSLSDKVPYKLNLSSIGVRTWPSGIRHQLTKKIIKFDERTWMNRTDIGLRHCSLKASVSDSFSWGWMSWFYMERIWYTVYLFQNWFGLTAWNSADIIYIFYHDGILNRSLICRWFYGFLAV